MVDHPFVRTQDFLRGRPGDYMGLCDESHLAPAAILRPDINYSFLPHGGPKPEPNLPRMSERKVPILFSGHLEAPEPKRKWQDTNPDIPDIVADIIFDAGEILHSEAISTLKALDQACSHHSIDVYTQFAPESLFGIVAEVERIAEATSRFRMLEDCKDLPLHLVTPPLPESYSAIATNWTHHGTASSSDFRDLVRNSRIVLNPTVKFANGAHDRVFLAQSQGAISATRFSNYLSRFYENRKGILYLERKQTANESTVWIKENLSNFSVLNDIADCAMAIYKSNHSWVHRARQILQTLSK